MLIDEPADLLRCPARRMAVRHVDGHAELLLARHDIEAFHVAVERIGEVVRAVDEQHRQRCGAKVMRRVPQRHPPLPLLGRHLREPIEPDAVFIQEPATVNRHGGPKAAVDPRDDAGQVAAPTDPGHGRPRTIDLGETSHQRMGADHIGDRVVGPLFPDRLIDAAELFVIALIGPRLIEPHAVLTSMGAGAFDRAVTGEVHRDRGVAALGPQMHPLGECRPTGVVGEHSGRLTVVRLARERQRTDG